MGSEYKYSLQEDKYSNKKYYILPYTMYEKEQTRKYKNDLTKLANSGSMMKKTINELKLWIKLIVFCYLGVSFFLGTFFIFLSYKNYIGGLR